MEEKELSAGELACNALMAKESLKSIGFAASSLDLEDAEPELKVGDFAESRGQSQPRLIGKGFTVVGLSSVENAYVMDLNEWVSHYSKVAGRQGFTCRIDEPLEKVFPQSYQLSTTGGAGHQYFKTHSGKILFSPPAAPYKTPLSGDLLVFSLRHKILHYLDMAITLITRCFPDQTAICLRLEQDPETDEEWLAIEFSVSGEIEQILDAYDRYTDIWVSLVPWPQREKIRLSYNTE